MSRTSRPSPHACCGQLKTKALTDTLHGKGRASA